MPLPADWSRTSVSSAAACSRSNAWSRTLNTAHIVYRMSSFRSRALGRFSTSVTVTTVPAGVRSFRTGARRLAEVREDLDGGGLGGGDAGGDADGVVGAARDGEARLFADGIADGRHPVQVADVVLRERAAPAGDPLRDASCCYPGGFGEFGGGERRQLFIVALQEARLADPADGTADDVHRRVPG